MVVYVGVVVVVVVAAVVEFHQLLFKKKSIRAKTSHFATFPLLTNSQEDFLVIWFEFPGKDQDFKRINSSKNYPSYIQIIWE